MKTHSFNGLEICINEPQFCCDFSQTLNSEEHGSTMVFKSTLTVRDASWELEPSVKQVERVSSRISSPITTEEASIFLPEKTTHPVSSSALETHNFRPPAPVFLA